MKRILGALASFALVFLFLSPAVGQNLAAILGGISASTTALFTAPQGALFSSLGYVGKPGGHRGLYDKIFAPSGEGGWGYAESLKNQTVQDLVRLEAIVDNTTGFLAFNTSQLDSQYVTERRINRNDHFVAGKAGLFLVKQDVANRKTNGQLHTYPNNTEFGAAYADLTALYTGGKLQITIDGTQIHPGFPCLNFMHVPMTQKSAATNYDQFDLQNSMVELTPNIRLRGAGTNDLNISGYQYAGFAGASAVAGTEHRAVLIFAGFTIRGAGATDGK